MASAIAPVLWTVSEVLAATGGHTTGAADWRAYGVAIDSRTTQSGDLFVAIAGPNHDGHQFVADAIEAGASAAIVADHFEGPRAGMPLVRVSDPLEALRYLAAAARERMQGTVIAVTGSVGKTGTKEALRSALDRFKPTHASAGSLNNHWGVPLSLARLPRDASFAVFEIGMNHAGEIGPLSRLVRAHAAIVTTVDPVHLEFFDSLADIADAKAEIFEGLEAGGMAILNRDNTHYEQLAAAADQAGVTRIIGFGESDAADARLIKASHNDHCTCISADICGQAMTYKVGAPGRHWVLNSLAVLATVNAVDGDLGLAGLALADLSPLEGRGQRTSVTTRDGTILVIDESYNANPASMRAAIELLGATLVARTGRRIAVLGDMLEMGAESLAFHKELAPIIYAASVDLVFCCGTNMKGLADALSPAALGGWADDSDALVNAVVAETRPDDVFMVKGSLGSRMAPIVQALKALDRQPQNANGG
jgi:UDP-N-acetylmuramoyl-tripeptide--D-alanyl-D-alanine ligase